MWRLSLLERFLWTAGLVCAAAGIFFVIQARWYLNRSLQVEQKVAVTARGAKVARPPVPGVSGVIGRMEIPGVGLRVPIFPDYDEGSLRKGVGHIQGTATPGGLGTVGLAGHRDTYFRPLRGVTMGMEIRLIDETGVYHYTVDSTEVVTPDRVEVLAIASRPELTLITYYPFDYIGAAPKRFIVHAHLLSALPDIAPP
jgi:sortase A